MQPRTFAALAIAALLTQTARADLTLRYKTTITLAPEMPAAMAEMMKQQMAGSLPPESSIRIKGTKSLEGISQLTSLIDYSTGSITLLHAPSKRYATIPAAEFPARMKAVLEHMRPPAASEFKMDIQAAKSGKTEVIHGLAADEIVGTISIDMPLGAGPQMQMRVELHTWTATADAVAQAPDFKEWNGSQRAALVGTSGLEMMSSAFAGALSVDKLRTTLQELQKDSSGLSLRTDTRIFIPMMAQMLKAQGLPNADGPLIQVSKAFDGFSADPLPDSLFQIPADYKPAPLEDLMAEMNPTKPAIPKK